VRIEGKDIKIIGIRQGIQRQLTMENGKWKMENGKWAMNYEAGM
jgi:hypothetical protein